MNDPLLNNTPPHNLDAEEAVLSALFINNKGFDDIEGLMPDDFYKGAHKKIFTSMLALKKQSNPVDLVTVASELQASGELESIGGGAYLAAICDAAPVAVNVGQYARVIQDLAKAREMIITASEIMSQGFQTKDIEQYISDSQSKILNIQTSTSQDSFTKMETLMLDAVDRIEEAQASKIPVGLDLGLNQISKFMRVSGSKLILLAGRPGMGKTSLALSIAKRLAYRETMVGGLSIEMDKEQFADKLIADESNVNPMGFYANKFLSDESIRQIKNAAENLSTIPLILDDAECNIEDVRRKCKKLVKMGCELIFIDQLSQISFDPKLTDVQGNKRNCAAIKMLTKELRTPIILLCQLNREVEKRNNKRPTLADLAETGRLEQDADMILFLYRDGYYNEKIDDSRTEIHLAKNRQGATGIEYHVLFKKRLGMFDLK